MSHQIAYYEQVQPFQRDLSNPAIYLNRRNALYRHLGMAPRFLFQQSILEFGPGFGENALFPLKQCPSRYVLVDANEHCLEQCRSRLPPHCPPGCVLDYRLSSIESYEDDERYDLVICESVIPREPQPQELLLRVARFVAPGGVLIITCQDPVSTFAELLRRLIVLLIAPPLETQEQKLTRLLPVFAPHLSTLKGMTRSPSDWLLDNLLRPWEEGSFSITDAIQTLGNHFDVQGSSPHFMTDPRWYRNIESDDPGFNQLMVTAYQANLHNLLDYRCWSAPQEPSVNRKLLAACTRIFQAIRSFETTGDRQWVQQVLHELQGIIEPPSPCAPTTAEALRDFRQVLEQYLRQGVLEPFNAFAPLFGRGQQYVSFIRREGG